jgi:multidrug efflux pump subunit AcrA (membrane-fusion protein)
MPGLNMQGVITRILPTVDERSRSFEVVVQVSGPANLVSGLFARARVKLRDIADAVVVPPAALIHDGARPGRANVFVIENGKAQSLDVELGVEGLDLVQIRSGIKPGMTVVVDPPSTLASGAPVQVMNAAGRTDR